MNKIYVYGMTGGMIPPETRNFGCVVCPGPLAAALPAGVETVAIAPLTPALDAIAARLPTMDVCVLASGDPLFFGIGRRLLERFGNDFVVVRPSLSSLQLLCARAKIPWDDLTWLSLHGRTPVNLPAAVLRHRRVALLTDPESSPAIILKLLRVYLDGLETGLSERFQVTVASSLGFADEKLRRGTLAELAGTSFPSPAILLLESLFPPPLAPVFGLREDEIQHSRGLITKDEVRAAALHALRLPTTGVFWDVGAGSGAVALEAARLAPGLAAYAIERHPEALAHIRANIVAFQTFTIMPVAGEAPEVLAGLPDPDRVFVGGSGGRLAAILQEVSNRLRPAGRVVIAAVTPATVDLAPQFLHQHGLRVHLTTITVTRRVDGAAVSLNPITLITGTA